MVMVVSFLKYRLTIALSKARFPRPFRAEGRTRATRVQLVFLPPINRYENAERSRRSLGVLCDGVQSRSFQTEHLMGMGSLILLSSRLSNVSQFYEGLSDSSSSGLFDGLPAGLPGRFFYPVTEVSITVVINPIVV